MPKFALPEDLDQLTAEKLSELKAAAVEAMDEILLDGDKARASFTMDQAAALKALGKDIEKIQKAEKTIADAEKEISETVAASREAREKLSRDAGDAKAQKTDKDEPKAKAEPAKAAEPAAKAEPEPEAAPAEVLEGELVTAGARGKTPVEHVLRKPTLNLSLRRLAEQNINQTPQPYSGETDLILTAGVEIPGFQNGSGIDSRKKLAEAMRARARSLPVTSAGRYGDYTVASMAREFEHVIGESTKPGDVERMFKELADPSRLWQNSDPSLRDEGASKITVAGGGFCAPPINVYRFFNIADTCGTIDLPTFGMERGSVNVPTSPSLADVFTGTFTSATNPWLWTNTDDIATVTGDPNKPCVRVPCPDMVEWTLECYGICLTAGNLTAWAWPEAVENQIALLMAAHYHAANMRYIQQIQAMASTCVTGMGAASAGTIAPVLGGTELQAMDYRTRYGMCETAVMEGILPYWVLGTFRSDGSKRTGVSDLFGMTLNQVADWFDVRNIRMQMVSDYQVRGSGQLGAATPATAWPTTVEALMWAPGTVMLGNGLMLNLGVVRDSVLNAENDHTALRMEECHQVVKFGHEVRCMQIPICTDGTTGANDLTACGP